MKLKFIIGLFLFATIQAQTAKVIALSPEDAKQIRDLYAQQAEITEKIDALNGKVSTKYIVPTVHHAKQPQWYTTDDWAFGFEYSQDFKYIVPKRPPSNNSCGFNGIIGPAGVQ